MYYKRDYSNGLNYHHEYYNSTIFSMNHKMVLDKIYTKISKYETIGLISWNILFKELNKISIIICIFCLTISGLNKGLKVQWNSNWNQWKIRR